MFPDLTRDDVFRIETRRLWLRWPMAKDRDAILKLAGDRAVAEMLARVPHPLPAPVVDTFLLQARAENAAGTGLTLALARRSAPASLIGVIGIHPGPEGVPELGYWLGGMELASSARTVNPASRRVLEACGFAQTGVATRPFPAWGADLPVDLFHLDRARWQARAAGASLTEAA